jgi:hypothetical protein
MNTHKYSASAVRNGAILIESVGNNMVKMEKGLRSMFSAPFEIRFTDNENELVNCKTVQVKR